MNKISFDTDKLQWVSDQPVQVAGRPLNLIHYGDKFRLANGKTHRVVKIAWKWGHTLAISISSDESGTYGAAFKWGAWFAAEAITEWIPTPRVGASGRHRSWAWCGKITGITPIGTTFIRQGNDETGISHSVAMKDLQFEWWVAPGYRVLVDANGKHINFFNSKKQ